MIIFQRLKPYLLIFLGLQFITRISLLCRAAFEIDFTALELAKILAYGVWFDVATAGFFLLAVTVYLLFLPRLWQGGTFDRVTEKALRFLFIFLLLFDGVAEHLFWEEFSTRFNFIAVDYLVYTQEVIGNIRESYPLGIIFSILGIAAVLITMISMRCWPVTAYMQTVSLKHRMAGSMAVALLTGIFYMGSSVEQITFQNNAIAQELSANGIYNLFHAFWHNEISYSRFYAMEKETEVISSMHKVLAAEHQPFLHHKGKDLTRSIRHPSPELHKNVILVVMESMSAEYMTRFGNQEGLTPNLDRLAREGLFFTQAYATGTRTVRGLEAVSLSIPPTPGQSILRRPRNENLFSLGFIFKDRGYDTRFIYGGYGYFDNMNAFFAGNGFDVVDRTDMDAKEIRFANVWGVCDEDLFARVLREADGSYHEKRPFMHLVMTTSNHRPYTYPENSIDIPSHTGRTGGVKYADYAIGKLIEAAQKKPWFKDTVFVFVADHTAGAGGKAELDPQKYHIPIIFYAPGLIKPEEYKPIISQIDLAPTLLGLLQFSYYTKFYGENVRDNHRIIPHAFISNYQKVALIQDDMLTVLSPKRHVEQYNWPSVMAAIHQDKPHIQETIAYYQSASWWKKYYRRIPTVLDQSIESRQ
jgi:phosphoglycerol transferase MdoB-like AlkP superfamily enzyme